MSSLFRCKECCDSCVELSRHLCVAPNLPKFFIKIWALEANLNFGYCYRTAFQFGSSNTPFFIVQCNLPISWILNANWLLRILYIQLLTLLLTLSFKHSIFFVSYLNISIFLYSFSIFAFLMLRISYQFYSDPSTFHVYVNWDLCLQNLSSQNTLPSKKMSNFLWTLGFVP